MKENDYFILFLGTLAMTALSVGVILFFVALQKKQMLHKLSLQQIRAQHHLELLQSSIAVQELERKRFSEDLHDDIGVILSTAKLCLIRGMKEKRDDLSQEALTLLAEAMKGVRSISHDLLPPGLSQFGLWDTLSDLCKTIRASEEVAIELNLPYNGELVPLKNEVSLAIYRVTKELLHNALKHSGADLIVLNFRLWNDGLEFTYTDNGKGFSSGQAASGKGLGLRNMESRISALNGRIDYTTAPGGGLTTNIMLPNVRL